jgi:O-antigen ligase
MALITETKLETPSYVSSQLIVGFCLLFVVLKAGTVAVTVVSILLCFWALSDAKQSIQALSLVVVIKHLNPMLITLSAEFGIVSWIILLVAGLRLFATGSLRQFKLLGPLLIFVMVVLLLFTVQINKYPEVSAMKLFVFTFGSSALLVGYAALNDEDADTLSVWFFSLFAAIVLLSLLTFAFPAVAYARNAAGFQGIMSHPQTFGPMLAPVASWLFAEIFFSKGDKLVKSLLLGLILIVLMIRSEARTGIVAVVLSIVTTFLVVFVQSKHFKSFRIGRFLTLAILAVALVSISLVSSTAFKDKLTGFVLKHHSKNLEQAVSSRSGGIASQWNFFKQQPLIGHGFGVYPSGDFPSEVVKVMGIPISAPVEKGFMPTAILEETGLTGALALLYFIATLGLRVSRNGDPRWLALFFACIFVNMGEMVFFSLGGIGLYFWLWLGLSTRIGQTSSRKQKRRYQALVDATSECRIDRQTKP